MASNASVGFGIYFRELNKVIIIFKNLKWFIIGTFLAIITPNIDSTVGLIGPIFFPLLLFSGKQ